MRSDAGVADKVTKRQSERKAKAKCPKHGEGRCDRVQALAIIMQEDIIISYRGSEEVLYLAGIAAYGLCPERRGGGVGAGDGGGELALEFWRATPVR